MGENLPKFNEKTNLQIQELNKPQKDKNKESQLNKIQSKFKDKKKMLKALREIRHNIQKTTVI